MTYEEFEKIITELKKNEDYIEELASLGVNVFERLSLSEMVVDLLEKALGDENDWLGWWIWEKDFGEYQNFEAYKEDGTKIPSETIRDIWNIIKGEI